MLDLPIAISEVLGGLALFLFGLRQLSGGLQTLAGGRLRSMLQRATRNRFSGYSLGAALGFLLHSSGATVMLVGFLNAGLISLVQAVPVVLGANLGTTLSMQAISFDITAFAYPALAVGMAATFLKRTSLSASGLALFGFGLLFLGMDIMSRGVSPYRETLRPLLENLDATTWTGLLGGILLSLLITSVVQSSGATLGMSFALIQAGVFTSLTQLLPIVLGAHIGTCVTAALASLGSQPAARRVPVAHVLFNGINVLLAIALQVPLLRLVEATSDDLVRQTANLHTAVMLVVSLALLPFRGRFTRLVEWVSPRSWKTPERSHLTPENMAEVETAVPAVRKELARLTRLAMESLEMSRELLPGPGKTRRRKIEHIEDVFDAIKIAMIRQLRELGHQPEVDRASILEIDHWIHCMVQMERIGDHLQSLGQISCERRREAGHILFGKDLNDRLQGLFDDTGDMLENLENALLEEKGDSESEKLGDIRRKILKTVGEARERLKEKMREQRLQPRALYFYSSYLEVFERLSRHVELVATESPSTYLERTGYEEVASDSPHER